MSTVTNGDVTREAGVRETYLHEKHPLRTFGFDSRLLGWECILSGSIKVGWENIECALKQDHRYLEGSTFQKMRNYYVQGGEAKGLTTVSEPMKAKYRPLLSTAGHGKSARFRLILGPDPGIHST